MYYNKVFFILENIFVTLASVYFWFKYPLALIGFLILYGMYRKNYLYAIVSAFAYDLYFSNYRFSFPLVLAIAVGFIILSGLLKKIFFSRLRLSRTPYDF